MPQCKRDYCREPAVDHRVKTEGFKRKQYCAAHYEEYKAKQRAYRDRQRTLPDCESGIALDCNGKVQPVRAEHGETTCRQCETLAYDLRNRLAAEDRKRTLFREAETVEELKAWIEEYML